MECERGIPVGGSGAPRASGDVRLITGGESYMCHGVVIKKTVVIGAALLHISREDRRFSLRISGDF